MHTGIGHMGERERARKKEKSEHDDGAGRCPMQHKR